MVHFRRLSRTARSLAVHSGKRELAGLDEFTNWKPDSVRETVGDYEEIAPSTGLGNGGRKLTALKRSLGV